MRLNDRSVRNLIGVHGDLAKVVIRASDCINFIITEGVRTPERQQELLAAGATRTLNSRHLTGHAIDVAALVGGQVRWDWPLYDNISIIMKRVASDMGIPLTWGGDWKSFRDGPHYELPWEQYP